MAEHRTVRAGSLAIRRLRRGETDLLVGHFLRLDPESRRRRFGRVMTDAALVSYAAAEDARPGVVEGAFVDAVLRGVAELRPFGAPADGTAEAAVSVEAEFQGRGIGTGLFGRIMLVAQNDGVRSLSVLCLEENTAMQRIARRKGGDLVAWPGEVVGTVPEPRPTQASLWQEEVVELGGRLATGWDWWLRENPFGGARRPSDNARGA